MFSSRGGWDSASEGPTKDDENVFIPNTDLLQWHKDMQEALPMVFPPDDKLFGTDNGQHPYGTKLRTYFDDDPNQPMDVEVRGSRWDHESCGEPMYVVLINGVLSQISLTSAHEEGGWEKVLDNGKKKKNAKGKTKSDKNDKTKLINANEDGISTDCINCDACGKSGPSMKCASCQNTYYCDLKCYQRHESEHRQECQYGTFIFKKTKDEMKDDYDYMNSDDDLNSDPLDRAQKLLSKAENYPIGSKARHDLCGKGLELIKLHEHTNGEDAEPDTIYVKAQLMVKDGRYGEEAVETMKRFMTFMALNNMMPDTEFAPSILLAEAHESAGEWEDAVKLYTELYGIIYDTYPNATPPEQRKIVMGISRCLYELGIYDQSVEMGLAAVEMNRHFPGVHKYIALSEKARGNMEEAVKLASRAVLYETPWNKHNKVEVKKLYQYLSTQKRNMMKMQQNTTATATSTATTTTNKAKQQGHILLFGIEDDLFKSCFGKDELWPCKIKSLSGDCTRAALDKALSEPNLISVVFQEFDCHYQRLKTFFFQGGFLIYFGIYGEYAAPEQLSRDFKLGPWSFSAYTKHIYKLTPKALEKLGNEIKEQQYTKCNLVNAPVKDRLMVPEGGSLKEHIDDSYYSDDDDYEEQIKKAPASYKSYIDKLGEQSPLLLHEDGHGGALCYLGFVNGDGNIPSIVRALVSRSHCSITTKS